MKSPLSRPSFLFLVSLLSSLALHVLAAVALVRIINSSRPVPSVHLEVSHVELSSAETPDDSAPAAEVVPSSESPVKDETPAVEPPMLAANVADLPQPEQPTPDFNPQLSTLKLQPPAAAPRQATVDAPPRPCQSIRPDYPRAARLRGEEGEVTLGISVGSDGAVEAVRVVRSSGFPSLDDAAVEAVRAARFSPATSEGRAVAASARLTLAFKLK